ncbi:MAG: AbrB/MazE/SpoVT family DNA-binding domain-containing protein [Limnochordia bacterium]|jgi:transcriptional pleiotropic regulator of transition state genes|nr:AbrB/MazE/SpoVT family DNA-binding domain-containing protein [Limnochordia bacterium]MDD4517802.1 AbrB/MazE/SpoVT family DNA-binding domain-containing protein [Limnochordia bacterium]
MKPTGIVRRLDSLGRIVIPKELRTTIGLSERDPVEIYVGHQNTIVLKKYETSCVICGNTEGLITFQDKLLCGTCLEQLGDLAKNHA